MVNTLNKSPGFINSNVNIAVAEFKNDYFAECKTSKFGYS